MNRGFACSVTKFETYSIAYTHTAVARQRCTCIKADGERCRAWALWVDPQQRCIAHVEGLRWIWLFQCLQQKNSSQLSPSLVSDTRLDALTAEAQRAIGLLQERRTASMSAAVTGKIDVRGLVESEAA